MKKMRKEEEKQKTFPSEEEEEEEICLKSDTNVSTIMVFVTWLIIVILDNTSMLIDVWKIIDRFAVEILFGKSEKSHMKFAFISKEHVNNVTELEHLDQWLQETSADFAMIKTSISVFPPLDLPEHPAAVRPLVAKVSSRTVSHICSSSQQPQQQLANPQPPKTLPKPVLLQQPPATLPKPTADVHLQQHPQPSQPAQPPPTYPKPFTHSPQTQQRPQRFSQPLAKPFPHAPPQTAPKPQGFPQALLKPHSHPLEPGEDLSWQSAPSGDLLSPTEPEDLLSDGMSSKQMSIKER